MFLAFTQNVGLVAKLPTQLRYCNYACFTFVPCRCRKDVQTRSRPDPLEYQLLDSSFCHGLPISTRYEHWRQAITQPEKKPIKFSHIPGIPNNATLYTSEFLK